MNIAETRRLIGPVSKEKPIKIERLTHKEKTVNTLHYPSTTPANTIGRYEIIYPIASGGMASVYTGRLSGMAGFERLFAIKIIHPHLAAERAFIEMFLDEARLAGRIHHPNVAEIFEVGEENGLYFMVGELVLGQDLKSLSDRAHSKKRHLPRPLIAHLLADVSRGLHEAHELRDEDGEPSQLVHRDISTRNILISYNGYAKLIDFGVAWARGRLSHTRDGSQKGKIGYMPPEQLTGKPIDRRADIYALGVVLYTLTVGIHPFPYENEGEQVAKMLEGRFASPRAINPAIEPTLERIILRAMSTDPEDRYETAAEMGKALIRYADIHANGDVTRQIAEIMQELFADEIKDHNRKIKQHRVQNTAPGASVNVLKKMASRLDTMPSRITEVLPNGEIHDVVINEGDTRKKKWEKTALFVLPLLVLLAIAMLNFSSSSNKRVSSAVPPAVQPGAVPTLSLDRTTTPPPVPAAPKQPVVIEVVGLHPDSIAEIDGSVTSLPIELAPSSTPVTLRIETPGFENFETTFTPSKDRTIHVQLKKQTPVRPHKTNKTRHTRQHLKKNTNSEPKQRLEGWEVNPFK